MQSFLVPLTLLLLRPHPEGLVGGARPHVGKRTSLVVPLLKDGALSLNELRALIGLRDGKSSHALSQPPAFELGLIAPSIPDNPDSRLQKSHLTA